MYSRLVYDGAAAAPSLLDIAGPDDRVIVCNSFSKTWAMTGWRLGWAVLPAGARDQVAEVVEVTQSGTAPFAQAGALAALADEDFVHRFRAHCAAGRAMALDGLAGLNGVRLAAPDGAFYAFIGVDGEADSLALALRLVRDHGVAVAPGSAFGEGGEGHLRLCFAQSRPRMERAMARLRAGLQAAVTQLPPAPSAARAARPPFRPPPAELAPDLDGRPGEPTRSTLPKWIATCRRCGASAPDLSRLPDGAGDTVRAPGLPGAARPRPEKPALRWACLCSGLGRRAEAAEATLQAAWALDDAGQDAAASAATPSRSGDRRTGRTTRCANSTSCAAPGTSPAPASWPTRWPAPWTAAAQDEDTAAILAFQRARIAAGDTARHMLSSALRPPARRPHVTHGDAGRRPVRAGSGAGCSADDAARADCRRPWTARPSRWARLAGWRRWRCSSACIQGTAAPGRAAGGAGVRRGPRRGAGRVRLPIQRDDGHGRRLPRRAARRSACSRRRPGRACWSADAGVAADLPAHPGLIAAKVRPGTRDWRTGPAMTAEELDLALRRAAAIVDSLADGGCTVLALGEMGIGNTASAALLAHKAAGLALDALTGRGAGLDDAGLARKRTAMAAGRRPRPLPASPPRDALLEYGGYEIAMLTGAILRAPERRVCVLVDGVIVTAAAVLAHALRPDCLDACIFAHRSAERGHDLMLAHLGVSPLLDLGMRLGEGTGAALAIPLLRAAAAVLTDMADLRDLVA